MSKKDLFVFKAQEIHQGRDYDYSKFEYKKYNTRGEIKCPKHGKFLMSPKNHIKFKKGCTKCFPRKKEKMSMKKFLERAEKIHGNKYTYDKFIFKDMKTKGIIICTEHGEFLQSPNTHINYRSECKICSTNKKKIDKNIFLKKAEEVHGLLYDYSKFKFENRKSKGIIICKEPGHGEFKQSYDDHVTVGRICPKCSIQKRKFTFEKFLKMAETIHGEKYGYDKFIFQDLRTKSIIICPNHGEFLMKPSAHLYQKAGCKQCNIEKKKKIKIILLKRHKKSMEINIITTNSNMREVALKE